MRYNKHVNIIYMPTQSNENSIHLRENKLLIQKLRGEDPSESQGDRARGHSRSPLRAYATISRAGYLRGLPARIGAQGY